MIPPPPRSTLFPYTTLFRSGRFNTSITHAYSIVIGSKHITLNATGGGFLTASKQFRHGATSKSRSNTYVYSRVNSKATTQWRKTESANGVHLEGVASDRSEERRVGKECRSRWSSYHQKKKQR